MPTKHYGLTEAFIDDETEYTGDEIALLHGIVDSQLNGALRAIGGGVVLFPDDTSFQVAAGSGLSVTVAPGEAVVLHSQYGGVSIASEEIATLAVDANATLYIHAGCEVSASNDSRKNGQAVVFASGVPQVNGATLLAEVTTGANGVTLVTDRREKSARLSFAGAYDATRLYEAQDLVLNGGKTWLAKRQSVGIAPAENADWTLFAGGGGDGAASGGAGGVLSGSYPNPDFAVDMATQSELDTAIATRAPLASPALMGTPTAPTAAAGTNTTQIANTAFVATSLSGINAQVFISTEAPPAPTIGALWLDTDETAPEAVAAIQGSLARETASVTTTMLAPNEADASTRIATGRTFLAAQLATGGAAWVRIYKNAAYRTADAARVLADPEGGENGLMLDIVTTGANLQYDLSPLALLSGDESELAMTVVNLSNANAAVTVTLAGIRLEN